MAVLADVTQVVLIFSVPYKVGSCTIRRSYDQRIGTIDFAVEADVVGDVLYDAIQLNNPVTVQHTCNSVTMEERGLIHTITEVHIQGARIKQIQCRTSEVLLQTLRIIYSAETELARNIVTYLITTYGPSIGVTLGSLYDHNLYVPKVSSSYDTLYDCMEQITAQTGLVWRIINNRFYLFLPDDFPCDPIPDSSFISGSMAIEYKLDNVYNVVRTQAWQYEDIEIIADPCTTYQKLPITGEGWELYGEITESPLYFPGNFKVNAESLEATWDQNPQPFYAQFQMRRLRWFRREDAASVALYGRREAATLYHDDAITYNNAGAFLEAYLARWSMPYFSASGIEVTGFLYDTDCISLVNLPAYGINQSVYITQATKTYSRTELIITLDIVSRSGITGKIEPSSEMMKRIQRLEKGALYALPE